MSLNRIVHLSLSLLVFLCVLPDEINDPIYKGAFLQKRQGLLNPIPDISCIHCTRKLIFRNNTMPVAFIVSSPLKRVFTCSSICRKRGIMYGKMEKKKGTQGGIAALDSNNHCRFCIIMPIHCLLPWRNYPNKETIVRGKQWSIKFVAANFACSLIGSAAAMPGISLCRI